MRYLEVRGSIYTFQKTFENGKLIILPTPPAVSRFTEDGFRFYSYYGVTDRPGMCVSCTNIPGSVCMDVGWWQGSGVYRRTALQCGTRAVMLRVMVTLCIVYVLSCDTDDV